MAVMNDVGDPLYVTQNMTDKIRVLFVDHDGNNDTIITEMFAHFSCEVTIVKVASSALSILSKGKSQFDLLMENVHSPDLYGFKLLQYATKMDLPVILLTNEDDPLITMRAIEEGAILCIQKPITLELIKYLWQHVLREKICKTKLNKRLKQSRELCKLHDSQTGQAQNNDIPPKTKRTVNRKVSTNNEERNVQDHGVVKARKKGWIQWTPELHENFLSAVRILGDGGCFPKDILELMNVPGLKRMQVASHLQKCRYEDRRLNRRREHSSGSNTEDTSEDSFDIPPAKSRRFGAMPRLCNISPFNFNIQEYANNQVERSSDPNNINGQGYQVTINQQVYDGYTPFGHVDIGNIEGNGHVDIGNIEGIGHVDNGNIGDIGHVNIGNIEDIIGHVDIGNIEDIIGHVDIGNIEDFGLDGIPLYDMMLTCDAQNGNNITTTFPNQGMNSNGQLNENDTIYARDSYRYMESRNIKLKMVSEKREDL